MAPLQLGCAGLGRALARWAPPTLLGAPLSVMVQGRAMGIMPTAVIAGAAASAGTPRAPRISMHWCQQRMSADEASADTIVVGDKAFQRDEMTNASETILSKVGRGLHHIPNHPLKIIKDRIADCIKNRYSGSPLEDQHEGFKLFDDVNPVVTIQQNFDSVLVPEDHVSRSKSDNYYLNAENLLRAHTSAHQVQFMQKEETAFLVAGDVYRRDEIDRSHYPVFHQMEAVRLFSLTELNKLTNETVFRAGGRTSTCQELHSQASADMIGNDLKLVLQGLVSELFGDVAYRWVETTFPFTHPSWELEIYFRGEWLEVLGCGVIEQEILENADQDDKLGWAFGLGLERLAMVLFDITDIRLFWSQDPRFIQQFDESKPISEQKFEPFSKYPPCIKDIAFWLPEEGLDLNTFAECCRGVAGDLIEEVSRIDEFIHPKTGRYSHCYRIIYRSMDKVFTNEEINEVQETLRETVVNELGVELR